MASNNYADKCKWWIVENTAGVRKVFSGVYADDAREAARRANPEAFGTGTLKVTLMGSYNHRTASRGRRAGKG